MTATRAFVLVVLAIDGVISAILGTALLMCRIGTVPFPIGLVVSAVLNALLAWCALHWAPTMRWAGTPLWAFLVTVTALTFTGPGGSVVFLGLWPLWLMAAGILPAAYVLRRAAGAR